MIGWLQHVNYAEINICSVLTSRLDMLLKCQFYLKAGAELNQTAVLVRRTAYSRTLHFNDEHFHFGSEHSHQRVEVKFRWNI